MLTFDFCPSGTDNEAFKAEGIDFSGHSFTVAGRVSPEADGVLRLEWKTLYPKGDTFYYSGTLVDEYTITGWLGRSVDFFQWQFALKKIPAEYMIYRPRPHDLGLPPPVWPSISAFMSPDARPTATVADRGSMAYLVSDEHADQLETNSVDKMEANGDPQENAGAKTDTVSEPEDCTTEEVFIGSQAAANTDDG